MKRILCYLSLSFALFLPLTAARAEEGWKIDSFDSRIVVEEAGTVSITETIAVDFANLSKHGIYRDIPVTYTNADGSYLYTKVDVLSVLQDGSSATYTTTAYNGYLQLKIGDADTTISGGHTYAISYRATGILKAYESYDELYWNVTGNNWDVPISRASASIALPKEGIIQTACYYGEAGATTECTSSASGATARFERNDALQPGEGMTVALGYTSGMVPLLTVDTDQGNSGSPVSKASGEGMMVGFFISLAAGIVVLRKNYVQHGRDARVHGRLSNVVAPEYEAPLGLRPAEIGLIIDERADTLDISSSIVDLAVRGYLTITEVPKKGWFGGTDYQLSRTSKPLGDLKDYERELAFSLFKAGETILISSLTNTFYTDLASIKQKLYSEITSQGFFAEDPNKVRNRWVLLGIGSGIAGFIVMYVGELFGDLFHGHANGVISGIGITLLVLAIPVAIMSRFMPARTEKGRDAFEKIRGYKMFLSATEKYRQPYFESQNFFMDVLPYAMVFGVTAKLASSFARMGIVPPAPAWYVGTHPFNPTIFGNDLTIFSKSLSSAMASTPRSSGSGGGGFSGGGFGGGGGGSW